MIIISQKRHRILNFDRTNEIWVTEPPKLWKEHGICEETDNFILQCGFEDNNIGNLGFYETEERAKEVLEDLILFYSKCVYDNRFSVYRMPEE